MILGAIGWSQGDKLGLAALLTSVVTMIVGFIIGIMVMSSFV